MKNKKSLRTVRKWLRLHSILTAVALGVYFFAAFFQGPGFFIADIRSKIHAIADTITLTATVLDVPVKPVVVASVVCNSGSLSIDLDWADDGNSYTYEISRDGVLLVTGLTDSFYHDTPGVIAADYDYIVTSYGPMGPGFAISDAVSVTTPSECAIGLFVPDVRIVTIGPKSFSVQSGNPKTEDRTPSFSGTTNISFAIMDVIIHSDRVISLRATANANGYWEVTVPTKLSKGDHAMSITATDPTNSSIVATYTLYFRVIEDDNSDQSGNIHHRRSVAVSVPAREPTLKDVQAPLLKHEPASSSAVLIDFLLHIVGSRTVFQGDILESEITPYRVDPEYSRSPVTIRYQVIDSEGLIIATLERQYGFLKNGQSIRESISIPSDSAAGEYILQAEVLIGDSDVFRQIGFLVEELPLLTLGGGVVVTYPQFVRNIGWAAFVLLFSTFAWLWLWIREYWLYAHAARHVVESSLSRKGLISKRKGVSQ